MCLQLLAGRQHVRDRRRARLDDRAHRLLDDVRQAALLVARRGVGAAIDLAALQVGVVPGHLVDHALRHLGRGGARGQLVDAVAHFGGLGEHHARAGAHQQVGAEAHRRVGGDAGEGIAAAALHADHEFARRHGFAPARVQAFEVLFGGGHDRIDHRHEADMLVVLQADHVELRFFACADIGDVALIDDGEAARRQQALGLQLLAAQAHHHHLAAEVRVQADVAQRADRDLGAGRVDGHAAAVGVFEADHVVDVRELRQQLGLDALHREVEHAGHALHRGRDRQDVARADRAVGVAKAFEGVALERRQRRAA